MAKELSETQKIQHYRQRQVSNYQASAKLEGYVIRPATISPEEALKSLEVLKNHYGR